MPYPPNAFEPNGQIFNGGTVGQLVTAGQYALDWIVALGGEVVLSNNFTTMNVVMPFQPDNTPTPIPQGLQALIQNDRESIIAAVRGVAYPPLPPQGCL
jgi:hypothetical protein